LVLVPVAAIYSPFLLLLAPKAGLSPALVRLLVPMAILSGAAWVAVALTVPFAFPFF
jgi:hypothetical protein